MRFNDTGIPVVILSHRKDRYLERTVASLRKHGRNLSDVIVVDDSGDAEHHQWLDDHGFQFSVVDAQRNAGYLEAMKVVWRAARQAADQAGTAYALLWEEDFWLSRTTDFTDLAIIMSAEENSDLAQLNLQRQAVYRIERVRGYLESHQHRGYGLTRTSTHGMPWVRRQTPFTTNPGLIRREVLSIPWPARQVCDLVPGGAEPAMSEMLEAHGYHFGWFGKWNQRYTMHVGSDMKSGHGY